MKSKLGILDNAGFYLQAAFNGLKDTYPNEYIFQIKDIEYYINPITQESLIATLSAIVIKEELTNKALVNIPKLG